jgi:hypothetical protein
MMAETKTEMETNQERMETKTDAHLKETKAEIRANNEKFEVLRGALVSRMDIHQARTQYAQEEMKVKKDIYIYIKRIRRPQYTPFGPS